MKVEITEDQGLIEHMLCDKNLLRAIMPDLDAKKEDYKFFNEYNTHILYIDDSEEEEKILGFTCLQPFTPRTVIIHMNILSRYWGTAKATACHLAIEKWLLENTEFRKIIAYCPAESAFPVIRAATQHANYQVEGCLSQSVEYHGKLQDMIVIGKNLE